jgi:RAT1-interacting protein
VLLRKKSGVVEVRRVGEGVGGIVSEEFLRWRGRKEKGNEQEEVNPGGLDGGKEGVNAETLL